MIGFGWSAVVAGVFLGDLWIKDGIERNGTEGETKEWFGGKVLIRKHHNRGAVLNAGESRRALVAAVSVAMTAVVAVLFVGSLGHKGNGVLRAGLALLLGGAFSNTYDRLKRKYVVDYLSFGVRWKRLRGVVFNISDFCIIIGALTAALGAAE